MFMKDFGTTLLIATPVSYTHLYTSEVYWGYVSLFWGVGEKLWWFLEGKIVLEVGEEGIMMGQCLSVNQGHFQSEIAGITYKIYISVKVYL